MLYTSDSFRLKISRSDAVFLSVLTAGLVLCSGAYAQNSPIDDLETETAKLTDVYDSIVPVAVGAAVFSVGMMMIKRVAFS